MCRDYSRILMHVACDMPSKENVDLRHVLIRPTSLVTCCDIRSQVPQNQATSNYLIICQLCMSQKCVKCSEPIKCEDIIDCPAYKCPYFLSTHLSIYLPIIPNPCWGPRNRLQLSYKCQNLWSVVSAHLTDK